MNAAYFCDYKYTIKNEETGEEVHVFRSAFTVKSTSSNGGFRELDDAFEFAQLAYLSRVRDDSELWGDSDAAALKERSREIISRPQERQENGFSRNFRPGATVTVVTAVSAAGTGVAVVASTRIRASAQAATSSRTSAARVASGAAAANK